MYPGTDYPNFKHEMPDFASLRDDLEAATYPGDQLNTILSWACSDDAGEPFFGVLLFMPRKSQTIWWQTLTYDQDEVNEWIDSFLLPCVFAWFEPHLRAATHRHGLYSISAVKSLLKSRAAMIRQRGKEPYATAEARTAHTEIARLLDQFADRFPARSGEDSRG